MGGQSSICKMQDLNSKLMFERQIKIYEWRAYNKSNISTVYFHNSIEIYQQNKLKQFIRLNKESDFLQIQKLNKFLSQSNEEAQKKQIIIFQKYICNFQQINRILNLNQAIYCIINLVDAFEQLKKKYFKVFIHPKCCFINKSGEVKAWINSNVKSNYLQQNEGLHVFDNNRQILLKILKVVENASENNQNQHIFFKKLYHHIDQIIVRNQIYQYIKNWIKQECCLFHIPISQNIKDIQSRIIQSTTKKIHRSLSSKNSRISQKQLVQKQIFSTQFSNKNITVRQSNINQHLCESKVSVGNIQNLIALRKSYVSQQSKSKSSKSINQTKITFNPLSFSQHVIKPTPRLDDYMKRIMKKSQVKDKQLEKQEETIKQQETMMSINKKQSQKMIPFQIAEQRSSVQRFSNLNKQSQISNFLTEYGDCSVKLIEKSSCLDSRFKKISKQQLKKRPSILEDCQKQNSNNLHKDHYKTSIDVISNKQIPSQKYWFTNKTIRKLVQSKQQVQDSLVHSIGTSSQNIQENYQGLLANMAKRSLSKRLQSYQFVNKI